MWTAKFKIWHEECVIRPRCAKYKVTDFVYLLSWWIEKDKFYYTELHILQGSVENKRKFIQDFKKEKSLVSIEQVKENFMTLNVMPAENQFYKAVFDPRIIYVKPVVQRTDGYEDWEMACWDKEPLMEITKVPAFDVEIQYIKQQPLGDIFMKHISPNLSPKQKEAIELAVKEGYYEYPRKVELEELGKIAGVARQTYQEHLRKAEKKIIPFLTDNLEA
ncbi:helix-turn-helix domain-containing protein [Nanoarchaeota archaeon]